MNQLHLSKKQERITGRRLTRALKNLQDWLTTKKKVLHERGNYNIMDNQTMFAKTIGLQKTAFNNTLTIFSTLQHHGEDLLKMTLEKNPWLPKSSKNACLYWSDFYSKYLENLRSVANQGFAEIERISSPDLKPMNQELPSAVTTKQFRHHDR